MPFSISKSIFSIISIPIILAILWVLPAVFISIFFHSKYCLYFLAGLIAQSIIHFKWRSKTDFLYTLSHEMSHAIGGILQGIKIKKISIRKRSGYVAFKGNTNFITELMPYFLPFYAILIAVIYFSLGVFYGNIIKYLPIFLFLAGFSISFHILNTIDILSGPLQSDCKKAGGKIFSYTTIILFNMIAILFILKLLFPDSINFSLLLRNVSENLKNIIHHIVFLFKFAFNTAKIYF